MAAMAEHERVAMEKHRELMKLPSVGVRLVDHNLTKDLLSARSIRRQELNVFKSREDAKEVKPGFELVRAFFGNSRLGSTSQDSYELTNWSHTAPLNAKYAAILASYWGFGKRGKITWSHYHGIKPEKVTRVGEDAFERFRNDIRGNAEWRAIIRALPKKFDEKSLHDEISRLTDKAPREKITALMLSLYSPRHAETLKRFLRKDFGRLRGERDRAIRAVAYFSPRVYDHFSKSFIPQPPFAYFSVSELKQLSNTSPTALDSSSSAANGVPYAYNAAAFVHPSRVVDRFGAWQFDNGNKDAHPVHGLMVLEPSVPAARELAERLLPHWKEHPENAFPVYDYKGKLVWPQQAK